MDTFHQLVQPDQKNNLLAVVGFVLGLLAMIFPLISVLYLVTLHGGPGYLQSLICGVPIAVLSIIAGILALVQIRNHAQAGTVQTAAPPNYGGRQGAWMAALGIILGILFFSMACILVFVLIGPFLLGRAG